MKDLTQIFDEVYQHKQWGNEESLSGVGSSYEFAKSFLLHLDIIITKYNITTISDLSCGDCNWIKHWFGNIKYHGYDVSKSVIEANLSKYRNDKTTFTNLDILSNLRLNHLHELCIIRHTFEHLPTTYIIDCLKELKHSSQFAIITSANHHDGPVADLMAGANAREINLLKSPFIEIIGKPEYTFWDTIGHQSDVGCFGYLYKFK